MKQIKIVTLLILSSFIFFSCSTENTPVYQLSTSVNPAEAGSVSSAEGEYDEGTEVSITATPNEGWLFDEWQGDLSGSENPKILTMDSDKNITAFYIKKTYPLTVSIEGEGEVQEEKILEKSTDYEHGTVVVLKAEPAEGWEFVEWSGAVESTEISIQMTVEEPAEIIATFEKNTSFFLAENGVTIKCPTAEPGEKGTVDGVEYEAVDIQLLRQRISEEADLTTICTSLNTNMGYLFDRKRSFNQPIGNWDVSNVTNMDGMFLYAVSFNQPIGNWDVSEVTSMYRMFAGANSFNQPIGNWDVGNVTSMLTMFSAASSFNQPIGNWDVSNVTDMIYMFSRAKRFDQPIGNWDVSNVIGMSDMFNEAESFNQPIGDWDVSNVLLISGMFLDASSFDQNLTTWCVSNISSEPTDFSTNSPLEEENKPIWGTCPE